LRLVRARLLDRRPRVRARPGRPPDVGPVRGAEAAPEALVSLRGDAPRPAPRARARGLGERAPAPLEAARAPRALRARVVRAHDRLPVRVAHETQLLPHALLPGGRSPRGACPRARGPARAAEGSPRGAHGAPAPRRRARVLRVRVRCFL